MEWVIGIGIGLFLLFRFTKQSLILVGTVAGVGALVAAGFYAVEKLSDMKAAKVVGTVTYDLSECTTDRPLLVEFRNEAGDPVTSMYYGLVGYDREHSDPVYDTGYSPLRSTFIIQPEKIAGGCHALPNRMRTASVADRDLLWKVQDVRPVFGEVP